MASSVMRGQPALLTTLMEPSMAGDQSIINYDVTKQLRFSSEKSNSSKQSKSKVTQHGMSVFKVSKMGKRQQRQIAISADNRYLLISSDKFAKGKLKVNGIHVKQIPISSIDRIDRGQITKKFLNKTKESATMKMPIAEDKLSLSIIFRISNQEVNDLTYQEDLYVVTDSSNVLASLDLVIPSHHEYELLITTLKHLMECHRQYAVSVQNSILNMQYQWIELNKPFSNKLSQNEWVLLCNDRISVPIGKAVAAKLYQTFCSLNNIRPEDGITLRESIDLLHYARQLAIVVSNTVDPIDDLWNKAIKVKNIYYMNNTDSSSFAKENIPHISKMLLKFDRFMGSDDGTMILKRATKEEHSLDMNREDDFISAQAFLSFLREEQMENDATLHDVQNLFERLNAKLHPSQLSMDGVMRQYEDTSKGFEGGKPSWIPKGTSKKGKFPGKKFSRNYISKDTFISYLSSDLNDAFDPTRGQLENDDMSLPLNCYWINSSHDTYLKNVSTKMNAQLRAGTAIVDAAMYAYALNRGCRFVEVDVWDGYGSQKNEPVVRSGDSKSANTAAEGILFSDVVKVIHSFLLSRKDSLPIILNIESNCSKDNQDKMADILKRVLADDDMLYIPGKAKIRVLPSPDKLRGKLVVKFKHVEKNSSRIFYNDYDDQNDMNPYDKNSVIDFLADVGSKDFGGIDAYIERAINFEKKTPNQISDELLQVAKQATRDAEAADEAALDAKMRSNRAQDFASQMMSKAGLAKEMIDEIKVDRSADEATISKKGSSDKSKSQDEILNHLIKWVSDATSSETSEEREEYMSRSDDSSYESRDDSIVSSFNMMSFNGGEIQANERNHSRVRKGWIEEIGDAISNSFRCSAVGSLANVERKVKEAELADMEAEAGVEVKRYYSAGLDALLRDQEQAEEQEAIASKDFTKTNLVFKQRREEYIAAKEEYETAEKFTEFQAEQDILVEKVAYIENEVESSKNEYESSLRSLVEDSKSIDQMKGQLTMKANMELRRSDVQEKIEMTSISIKNVTKKYNVLKAEHEKINNIIRKIEGSHNYTVEKRQASRGELSDGVEMRRHRTEVEKLLMLNEKLVKITKEKKHMESEMESLNNEKVQLDKSLSELSDLQNQFDQLSQKSIEKQKALQTKKKTCGKATEKLIDLKTRLHLVTKYINDAKFKSKPNLHDLKEQLDRAKRNIDVAEQEFLKVQKDFNWVVAHLKECNDAISANADAFNQAKFLNANMDRKYHAEQTLKENALNAYKRYLELKKEAEAAKVKALHLRDISYEKIHEANRAKEFKDKQVLMREISPSLSKLSLLSSTKFQYYEESVSLAPTELHNISEGQIIQTMSSNEEECLNQYKEMTRDRLIRVFPSRHKQFRSQSNNFNPVMFWSMGCQIASMNQQICDAFVLVNDGRFRTNGSCGYVLKPSHMTGYKSKSRPSIVSNSWTFKVLSASNLPKSKGKELSGSISPRVRVTLYDGGSKVPQVHLTEVVKRNGYNPVWSEGKGVTFNDIAYPESAVVLFSVWNSEENGAEDFIAAAAIPLDSMRLGYRSISLFDANHMKCGDHAFASLLVHVQA